AYFDVLDAALAQHGVGPFAAARGLLGPDAGIVFVLDLQDVGVQLDAPAVAVGAHGLVRRPRGGDGPVDAGCEGAQVVVAELQVGLDRVLVAQVAHAQAGGPGHAVGVRADLREPGFVAGMLQEAAGYGGRGSEQVHQQPGRAREVADQGRVADVAAFPRRVAVGQPGPGRLGQREVVVHAGNALHDLAVAPGQAQAVDVLEHAGVGRAVPGDGDVGFRRQVRRHGLVPDRFTGIAQGDEAVDVGQFRDQRIGV